MEIVSRDCVRLSALLPPRLSRAADFFTTRFSRVAKLLPIGADEGAFGCPLHRLGITLETVSVSRSCAFYNGVVEQGGRGPPYRQDGGIPGLLHPRNAKKIHAKTRTVPPYRSSPRTARDALSFLSPSSMRVLIVPRGMPVCAAISRWLIPW